MKYEKIGNRYIGFTMHFLLCLLVYQRCCRCRRQLKQQKLNRVQMCLLEFP